MDYNQICDKVIHLVREVGAFINDAKITFQKDQIKKKAKNDLVSYVDVEAEKRLVEGLSKILPDSGFIAEENTRNEIKEFNWIIDPLDGTTNFIHSIPFYCISVALANEQEILIGVVFQVCGNEIFYTYKGGKSFLNAHPISVTDNHLMGESLIATGFPVNNFDFMDGYKNAVEYFIRNTHGVRRMGTSAMDLCYVACGRFDGYFELNLKPWDVAAGALIVMNAGGVISDFSGGKNWLFGKNIIASSKNLNAEFTSIINDSFNNEFNQSNIFLTSRLSDMIEIDKSRIYKIEYPAIPSAGVYFFNTDSGIRYEVRFGRRQDNILHSTIVFGVVNEEFNGEEYVTTNRGEVYRVMLTISEIVRTFMKEHPKMVIYEFHAIDSEDVTPENENSGKSNARMYLYKRYLPIIFDENWEFNISGNRALVKRKNG